MSNDKPLVTVAIATYNRCEMLKKALDSVVNQTYKNLEIIIADNNSQDNTEKLCTEYAAKDKRIKYYRHKNNIGMYNNGQFVLKQATAEYYIGICDDDWISLNYIEEGIKTFIENPACMYVYGKVRMYDENGNMIFEKCPTNINYDLPQKRMIEYFKQGMHCFIAPPLLKLNTLTSFSSFTKNRFCEDQIYVSKLMFLGKTYVNKNITYYKINNGCTKNLETLVKTFNLEGFTEENFMEKLAQCHADAVLNDEFYDDRLTLKQRKKLAKIIIAAFKKTYRKKINFKKALKYMWRHPLFIFRRDFYRLLKMEFGL